MKENEAIEELREQIETAESMISFNVDFEPKHDNSVLENKIKTAKIAISALEEIQQYRAIGTVEECLESRERQIPKKYKKIHPCKSVTYYQCPCCNELLHINENFCGQCGQAISLWDEE